MARYCPHCHQEVTQAAQFCPGCGKKLTPMDEDATLISPPAGQTIINHNIDADKTIRRQDQPTQITPDPDRTQPFDDGQTVAMPEEPSESDDAKTQEDDGATVAMPATPEDDGETRAMPEDGATQQMPEAVADSPAAGAGEAQAKTTAVANLKTGRILQERYRLDKILGQGGFGAAYLAQDLKLKRVCVVKQMVAPEGTSLKELELYRSNFEREASLLVQLNHPGHPNIPEIYDYFSDAGGNYLVMKYIEGKSLSGVLEHEGEGKIPWREAVRYTIDVCSALHYMHTQGGEPVMHRDIKPANILLGDDGRVWLVDFGLAKAKPVQSTGDLMATQAAGSLGYTPLEQWLGEATPASDIYAVGATLHHLITGHHPVKAFGGEFNIQKLKDMHGHFTPARKIDKSLPKELDQIITRTTDPEPDQRLTAQQLCQELEALVSGTQAAALYTFKNGESAKTVQELVIKCEKNRAEAQEYLYRGDFERWFMLINRNDLADAAAQAVEQGKNRKDGLEKFLKLIIPNLFLNRLRRAAGRMSRATLILVFLLLIFVALLVIGGSYGAGWFIRQSLNNSAWSFDHLDLDNNNIFTETEINRSARSMVGAYVDEFDIDIRPPDQIYLNTGWSNMSAILLVRVKLESGKPHFYLDNLNEIPLFLVGENISQGINRGIDDVFAKAPVDISQLTVAEEQVVFRVKPSGRAPLPTPTPTITPTPTPKPTPTVTPTPVGMALVAVFNELGEDILIEIDDDTLEIPANGSIVFEKKPGTYNFVIFYQENGQVAAEGTKEWTVSSYKWRITP